MNNRTISFGSQGENPNRRKAKGENCRRTDGRKPMNFEHSMPNFQHRMKKREKNGGSGGRGETDHVRKRSKLRDWRTGGKSVCRLHQGYGGHFYIGMIH